MARNLLRFSVMLLLACMAQVCVPGRMQAQQSRKAGGDSAIAGKKIFTTTCAACHGLDGGGGEHGPDISRRPEVQRLPEKALLQIVREGIPATGMPAFGSLGATRIQAVVRYLRSLQQPATAANLSGDPKRGKALFFGQSVSGQPGAQPGCAQCHMVKGEGGFIGSDLSSYARTQSAADIRIAITDPNRNLDPRKRTVIVTTTNGQTLTGIARNEDNFSLQLQATDGSFHLLNKSDLKSIEYQPRSLMPGDYGSRLSRAELDDLVSYLVSVARNQNQPEAEHE
jgi:cytochrome c oxidase cbb3-type subunit III